MFGLNKISIISTGMTVSLGEPNIETSHSLRILFQLNKPRNGILYPDNREDQPVPEADLQDDSRQHGEEPGSLSGHH